jgi:hypothetical protein
MCRLSNIDERSKEHTRRRKKLDCTKCKGFLTGSQITEDHKRAHKTSMRQIRSGAGHRDVAGLVPTLGGLLGELEFLFDG